MREKKSTHLKSDKVKKYQDREFENLLKIPSTKYGNEAQRILKSLHPDHDERKFLVHYLRAIGKTDSEIFEIIDQNKNWDDYESEKTKQQIPSLNTNLKGSKIIKRRPPASIIPQREKGGRRSFKDYRPFKGNINIASLLKPYNQDFLFGANIRKYGILKNGREILSPYPDNSSNALVNTFYRSIEGYDHILFVIDIDRDNLVTAFIDVQKIYNLNPKAWTWVKFSGCKGFHLIQKIPLNGNGYDYDSLRKMGEEIENFTGVRIDHNMFNRNQLIRAYSVNFKSGLCSIPVDLGHDTLDDILLKSQTLELHRCNKINKMEAIEIVKYVDVKKPIDIELSQGRFIEIARKKTIDEKGEREYISLRKGEYYPNEDGSRAKRYLYGKNFSFGLSNGTKEKIIQALEEV